MSRPDLHNPGFAGPRLAGLPLVEGVLASRLFLSRMMRFICKHLLLRAAAAPALLTADFFGGGSLFCHEAILVLFDLVEQKPACQKPIEPLLPRCLAFYAQAGRTVQQHDAGGAFIDILTAMTTGTDKCFLDV